MVRKVRQVTEAEWQHVLQHRERIALDNVDWHARPYVTCRDLLLMSKHVAMTRFLDWPWDLCRQVRINPDHADNASTMEYLAAREIVVGGIPT